MVAVKIIIQKTSVNTQLMPKTAIHTIGEGKWQKDNCPQLVKYLYKYVFKGHDLISFKIISDDSRPDVDEIKEFQQGRWISPPEAFWRIFEFRLNEMTPAVYTLQVHLPGQQLITFNKNSDLLQLLRKIDFSKTMLTEFFKMNKTNAKAETLKCFYREFPEHFVWSFKFKTWTERKRKKAIGRLVTVSPREGERYYLRLLLTHVRAPTSFDDLLTINGQKMNCFRDAALAFGLLQSDTYIQETLEEAVVFQMPSSLRLLFATILVHCAPADPKFLWDKFQLDLSADYQRSQHLCFYTAEEIRNKVLQEIKRMVEQMGKSFADYHLAVNTSADVHSDQLTKEIECERNIEVLAEDLLMPFRLNVEQRHAYDLILQSVFSPVGQSFFIDGPGGTGKTFLYRSLLATLRSQGHIAIAVATSGVAASILPGGRTAHSRFNIPLDFSRNKTCQISKQGSIARLLFQSRLILWDEASMAKRETVEAFDGLLRDIMDCDDPFGGKIVVFGGDFRQTLPVIRQATKQVLIESSLPSSHLWSSMQKLQLVQNMRAILDPAFSELLLRIGEGREAVDRHGEITLPSEMVIPYTEKEESLNRLLQSVFPDLTMYSKDPYGMINRCVLAPKNSSVDEINDLMIRRFSGNLHVYVSSDRTVDPRHQGDYEDFLNSQNPKGLPPHKLLLKENCPIMLIRNLNPTEGLCNGTRLICRELRQNTICAEIAFGQHQGKRIFFPKIPLQVSDDDKNGLPFIRTQFPIRVCFALTINKSQGQTLDYVGIYLREPVFSHGQLYVALSRVKTSAALKVLILPGTFDGIKIDCKTRNVVFQEILQLTEH
ncbi:ATP-dependent DNA helicase PIF7-like [Coffea eugenioides]|uniref:ATP-dependent DNA helicase PIF7-like n=1 Tax=Coffea eugenioides TaxID=49369 RepID=UPI000F613578|nr:ATP-dependent DNA helicase PIF7-like [Coffea eugenioides]